MSFNSKKFPRRQFIKNAAITSLSLATTNNLFSCNTEKEKTSSSTRPMLGQGPVIIATWNVDRAVSTAGKKLLEGKSPLDAIVAGCNIEELDPNNQSVGLGGLPDRDGIVTLDACVMDGQGNYGAVMAMEKIPTAISVARLVMEKTPHVIMVGQGAQQFAVSQGFKTQNLLTPASRKAWMEWKKTSKYKPIINIENHDTIGMIAIDKNGDISGGCTTSGLAYKMHGRVGDSPVIGSGLFVDREVGGATATGMGEEVLKTVGSYLIVELMRQGKSPHEACKEAILRIVKSNPKFHDFQVGYAAVNLKGDVGYYSIHPGYSVTIFKEGKTQNLKSESYL